MRLRTGVVLAVTALVIASSRAASAQCVGDCNDDGEVTVNELIVGVNIALGAQPLSNCSPFDISGDGEVTVNELIQAVNNALSGCSACGNGTVEGAEQCDDGNTRSGDGCSSTCQCEPGSQLPECVEEPCEEQDGLCTLSDESGAIVQTTLFAIRLSLDGTVTFTAGCQEADGTIPISIKKDALNIEPIPVPGLVCACIVGVDDPEFEPGNAAEGSVGCGDAGLADVNYSATIDHNINDISPGCTPDDGIHPGVCNGDLTITPTGPGPEGSTVLRASVAFSLISDGGICNVDPGNSQKGPDGIPCTADDRATSLSAKGVLTSGTMTAGIFDVNNTLGRNMVEGSRCGASNCVVSATGAGVQCDELPDDPAAALSGSGVVLALPAIDLPQVGDIIVSARFFCE